MTDGATSANVMPSNFRGNRVRGFEMAGAAGQPFRFSYKQLQCPAKAEPVFQAVWPAFQDVIVWREAHTVAAALVDV